MCDSNEGLTDNAFTHGLIAKILDSFAKNDPTDKIAVFDKPTGQKVVVARITSGNKIIYISDGIIKTFEDLLDVCPAKKSEYKFLLESLSQIP